MILSVSPGTALRGTVVLPGDKSISHRAALFAALAEGESRARNFLRAGVTQALLDALTALGVTWMLEDRELRVIGRGLAGLRAPAAPLDCGNSATTLRLLAGALAAAGLPAVLDGSPGLRRRPMARIVAPLLAMGAPITAAAGGGAPLRLEPRDPSARLRGQTQRLAVASAQVKSCLLLAGLGAEGATRVVEPAPTRDHSERLLHSMGARIHAGPAPDGGWAVTLDPQDEPLRPLDLDIPGDFSAAAFLIVAAAVTPGAQIHLPGVGLNPGRTGLLDALRAMGAQIDITGRAERGGEPCGDLRVGAARLRGTTIDGELAVRMIDEFPALAVAAAYAEGVTRVRGAAELRHKESDRIRAVCAALNRLGADAHEAPDGFDVHGRGGLEGGNVDAGGDHRLAMALATAGLAARRPVRVRGAGVVAESFPDFAGALARLGADVHVEGE